MASRFGPPPPRPPLPDAADESRPTAPPPRPPRPTAEDEDEMSIVHKPMRSSTYVPVELVPPPSLSFSQFLDNSVPSVNSDFHSTDDDKVAVLIPNEVSLDVRGSSPLPEPKYSTASLRNLFPSFTQSELETYVDVFQVYDSDMDGILDDSECESLFRAASGTNPSHRDFCQLMNDAKESSGSLDVRAFLTMLAQSSTSNNLRTSSRVVILKETAQEMERVLLQCFRTFDPDSKGWISRETLESILTSMGADDEKLSPALVDSLSLEDKIEYSDLVKSMSQKCISSASTHFYPSESHA